MAQAVQCKTKQNCEQQHLQNVAAGKCANYAARNHIEQECDHALLLRLFGINRHRFSIKRCRVNVHPRTRLNDVNHNQADDKRNGADNFKVKQCHRTGAAHGFHAFHARDARHNCAEDNRGDNHFNQFNERIAEGFHLRA
ncbi:hypothetical protein D3C75_782680 [compost metagenome]